MSVRYQACILMTDKSDWNGWIEVWIIHFQSTNFECKLVNSLIQISNIVLKVGSCPNDDNFVQFFVSVAV